MATEVNQPLNRSVTPIVFGALLVIVGTGWLLNELQVTPAVDWMWTLGLAAMGTLVLFARGLNKASIVLGPLLIACGIFSLLRQAGLLATNFELPGLLIVCGVLIIISYYAPLPPPAWLVDNGTSSGRQPPRG